MELHRPKNKYSHGPQDYRISTWFKGKQDALLERLKLFHFEKYLEYTSKHNKNRGIPQD